VPPALARLGVTAREVEVLGLVADGLTNQAIAERLFVSPRTVEKHVERLVYKTQVGGRGELIAYANRV
jgi:DNA-binding CsgD family transcriptional regulator